MYDVLQTDKYTQALNKFVSNYLQFWINDSEVNK